MRSYAILIGEFAAGVGLRDLPQATVHAVRRHTLDTLGAAIAGAAQPEALAVSAAARVAYGQAGSAVVWGQAEPASPGVAALVNGTAAHALELDDASGCDHSGAVVIPAVFAALALPGASRNEEDIVAAIALGYDIGRRVMEAAGGYDGHNGAGWHSTATCGVFGAAVAVARVLNCDAAATANALGIASSFASGTWAFLAEGAMTKRMHPGHAANAGLVAVELGRAGMTGPVRAFEAEWGGFFRTYAPQASQPGLLVQGLGQDWRIHRSSIKPYASCRGTHAAIDAILALEGKIAPDELEAIEIGVTATVEKMCGGKSVRTFVDAQMSLPYACSVALLHGAADVGLFDAAHREDARVRRLMDRVQVRAVNDLPSNVAARVGLRLRSGAVRTLAVDVPLGSPGNALPDDALLAKYHGLADAVIGAGPATRLAERIQNLGVGLDARTLPGLASTLR